MAQSVTVQAPPRVSTFTALRNLNFRLYFIGQLISTSGTWMQTIAQGFLVFSLTKSELWLGIVACASGLPMLLLGPFAGVLVERIPRRRVLLTTQVIQMTLAFILTALVATETVEIWHIVVLALLLGTTNAVDAPARQTFISDLVGRELLPSGIALNSIIVNGSRAVGPTVAGLLLATLGTAWCFFLNGLSFVAVIGMLLILHIEPLDKVGRAPAVTQLREGLRYARSHPVVLPLLLLSSAGGIFCWSVITQLPSFADTVLRSPDTGYAMVSAANGVGAIFAGLFVTSTATTIGRGRWIVLMGISAAVWLFLMAQTTTIPAATAVATIAGFCVIAFFVTINTTIQITIPNEYRGRVMSLYTLTIIGFTPFGSLALGGIAEAIGVPQALALYAGLFGVIVLLVALRFPSVLRVR